MIACGKISNDILIDSISGVVNIEENFLDSKECSFNNDNIAFIDSIAKLFSRLVIIINIQKLIPVTTTL